MSNYKLVPLPPVKIFLWTPACVYRSIYERDGFDWLRFAWLYDGKVYMDYGYAAFLFNEDCISERIDSKPHYKYNWKLNKAELVR